MDEKGWESLDFAFAKKELLNELEAETECGAFDWHEQCTSLWILLLHKNKAIRFLTSAGVQFSMEEQRNNLVNNVIKTDDDLVNLQNKICKQKRE